MWVARLSIENFRGIRKAELNFSGHSLLIGANNVGKSTLCEALELALGPDRLSRSPPVEEFDFYNAGYLKNGEAVPIRIELTLVDVAPSLQKTCAGYLDRWHTAERRVLESGEIDKVDGRDNKWCLRLLTLAAYNEEEDEFEAETYFLKAYDPDNGQTPRVPRNIKRTFGFLYLRALRTGSRALSLERGSLLDVILRLQSMQTGIWENVRSRLQELKPPIDAGSTNLTPVLQEIERRIAEYIPLERPGETTRLFVSQLTREHLRKTISFFVSLTSDQEPVPFQDVGTGTLNTLVLALLSFIAELKKDNVLFAMEEPETALPPHIQRRIANYLLGNTTQCFVTSHSPYVIERFAPEQIMILRRDSVGTVSGMPVGLSSTLKAKTYRKHVRRGLAEAMLGRGVIVTEGFTEQVALTAVATKMEAANPKNFPLDLAGVTIFSADGDGSIAEFGRFFKSLDLRAFAFLDKKARAAKEQAALQNAGFDILNETNYASTEALLAAEVPLDRQWEFLDRLRKDGLAATAGIPASRPTDQRVRELTEAVLKDAKGWGRAADFIEICQPAELPKSLTSLLEQVYKLFPRPERPKMPAPAAPDAGTGDAAASS
jgi:putative ATP-dependent endonuclease of the OLD family